MKKSVAIIGAGYAGITSAVFLDHSKFNITIFESTNHIGGRAFSYFDKQFESHLDNGQHMMMACYEKTLLLFSKLGINKNLYKQSLMKVPYSFDKKPYYFKGTPFLPAPFHLLYSMLFHLKPLSFLKRCKLLIPSLALFYPLTNSLKKKSVSDWLKSKGQCKDTIKYVWEPIAIGTMNDQLENLSAYTFKKLLQILFIKSAKNSNVIFPKVGLTELVQDSFNRFCNEKNIKLRHQAVTEIREKDYKHTIVTKTNNTEVFDYIISAIPYFQLEKIFKPHTFPMKTTSIVSIHFLYEGLLFDELFIGLPNSKIQWVFNKEALNPTYKNLYSCTISAPEKIVLGRLKNSDKFIKEELSNEFKYFDESKLKLIKVIHEKRATFSDSIDQTPCRPNPGKFDKNLYLCGDWTNTEFPATIESACLSAIMLVDQFPHS